MDIINIHTNSKIKTLPISSSFIDNELILGSTSFHSSFIKTNQIGLETIDYLNQGFSFSQTECLLKEKYNRFISIRGLVETLFDANLIYSIDNHNLMDRIGIYNPLEVERKKFIEILFSKPAYLIYSIIFIWASAVLFTKADLYEYIFKNFLMRSLNYPIITFFLLLFMVLKHEIFHFLAAISLNVPASIKLGYRFVFLTLETQADSIYLLPKFKRQRFYLSGIIGDIIFISVIIVVYSFFNLFNISWCHYLLTVFSVQIFISILFQFDIFLKTDIYFVFTDLIGKENLYSESGTALKYFFNPGKYSGQLKLSAFVKYFAFGRVINYLGIGVFLFLFMCEIVIQINVFQKINLSAGSEYLFPVLFLIVISMWVKIIYKNNKTSNHKIIFDKEIMTR
jgi:hypothetical protein